MVVLKPTVHPTLVREGHRLFRKVNPIQKKWGPMETILGFDPGLTGAVAVIGAGPVSVWDLPVLEVRRGKRTRKRINSVGLAAQIEYELDSRGVAVSEARAWIELCFSRPGEGVGGAFSFGKGCGTLEGICAGLRLSWDEVTPVVWKREMGVRGEKDASVARASQLFPALARELITPRGRALHGRADALLIAAYGYRQVHGGFPIVSDHPDRL